MQELSAAMPQEKTGLFSRIANMFSKTELYEGEETTEHHTFHPEVTQHSPLKMKTTYQYQVTVRRQIISFQDAVTAADGLKRGEQQILNLSMTDPTLREKIKDFMCGVNYALEGSWEEIGDNVYLLAPNHAFVEVAPASARMTALRN